MQIRKGMKVWNKDRGNIGTVVDYCPALGTVAVYFYNKKTKLEATVDKDIKELRSLHLRRKLSFYPQMIHDYLWWFLLFSAGYFYVLTGNMFKNTDLYKNLKIIFLHVNIFWIENISSAVSFTSFYAILCITLIILNLIYYFKGGVLWKQQLE